MTDLSHRSHRMTDGRSILSIRCMSCGETHLYPRGFCPSCGSRDLDTPETSGNGVVAAVTVIHRAPSPDHRKPPYAVVLVDLDEGPRVMGHASGDLAPGDAVRAEIDPDAAAPITFRQSRTVTP